MRRFLSLLLFTNPSFLQPEHLLLNDSPRFPRSSGPSCGMPARLPRQTSHANTCRRTAMPAGQICQPHCRLNGATDERRPGRRRPGTEDLPLPQYDKPLAGLDIYAANDEPVTIAPGDVKLIPAAFTWSITGTGQVGPAADWFATLASCSRTPGTIDADYRGGLR